MAVYDIVIKRNERFLLSFTSGRGNYLNLKESSVEDKFIYLNK